MTARPVVAWCALGALVIALLGVVALSLVHRNVAAVGGQEIVYDDFGFSLRSVRTARELGSGAARMTAHGTYYVVELQVANHAQRVDYRLDSHRPWLCDASGAEYAPLAQAQALLVATHAAQPVPAAIAAGTSCVTTLVFDAPADAEGLYVRIGWGPSWVDALDLAIMGNRRLIIE
jgi:hypothetical protein